jgi:hypothetical protein
MIKRGKGELIATKTRITQPLPAMSRGDQGLHPSPPEIVNL